MKKQLSAFLAAVLALGCLSACGSRAANDVSAPPSASTADTEPVERKTIQIVTTIFPEYDWVKAVLGGHAGRADITMLLDNGVDLHSYQPTAEDILRISTCDLFIYVGGESDKQLENALREPANENRKVINLLEALGDRVKEEEIIEGMETGDHAHDGGDDHEHSEAPECDEHVWLSLRNAAVLCGVIADALSEIDLDNADGYQANAAAYTEKLMALDAEYQSVVDAAPQKTLLFGDRFPFRYLVDDYGLSYYAAFAGCSAETEASFETIVFLAGKVDELGLTSVLTLEKSDQKIARTIVQNTKSRDQQILVLDSMQSTTFEDVSGGAAYLSIMESNLAVLREALQ